MNKTIKRIIILCFLFLLLILYLINASLIIKNIVEYTNLFFTKLFPANFIFFTISSLLIEYGLIEIISSKLRLNTASLYIFFMSLISGFPSGCNYSKELWQKKLITDEEANYIVMSSHFPNPLFVLGTVSMVLNNKIMALKIYLSLIIGNLIIFLLTRKKDNKIEFNYFEVKDFSTALSKAINKSLKVIVLIYGTAIFFYLISSIINKYLILNVDSYVIINGIFDLTKGISSLSLINNIFKKALLALIFLSLGGISIHMQVKSIIAETPIKYRSFLKGRIIGTVLSIIIFLLLYTF